MSRFRDAYDEFRRLNVEVATISVDSPYSHRVWARELNVPFPMISDFPRTFMDAYRVPLRENRLLPGTSARSAFLVDASGVIRYAWYQPEGGGTPPVEEVLEACTRLTG